jgi:hypothetical protein
MVSLQNIRQHHQSQTGMSFGFDETLKQKARQIGAKWCQSYNCWYVDYNKENHQNITSTFPDIEILHDTTKKPETLAPGLKHGHDIAPIADCKTSSALQLQNEIEHKAQNFVKLVYKKEYSASWDKTKPNKKIDFGSQQCPFELVTKSVSNEFKKSKINKFLQLLRSCVQLKTNIITYEIQ